MTEAKPEPVSQGSSGDEGAEHTRADARLRRGKWTPEEEEYTSKIIRYFNRGLLRLPEGTTLRSYLAEQLKCDPMRITKKYSGPHCLGKRVFHPCEQKAATAQEMEAAQKELNELYERFVAGLRQPPRDTQRRGSMVLGDRRRVDHYSKDITPPVQPWKEYMPAHVHTHPALIHPPAARSALALPAEVPTTTQLTYAPYPLSGYPYTLAQPTQIMYSPPPFYSYVVAVPQPHAIGVPSAAAHLPPAPPAHATQFIYHPHPHGHPAHAPVTTVPLVAPPLKHARVMDVSALKQVKRSRASYSDATSTTWDQSDEHTLVHSAPRPTPQGLVFSFDRPAAR